MVCVVLPWECLSRMTAVCLCIASYQGWSSHLAGCGSWLRQDTLGEFIARERELWLSPTVSITHSVSHSTITHSVSPQLTCGPVGNVVRFLLVKIRQSASLLDFEWWETPFCLSVQVCQLNLTQSLVRQIAFVAQAGCWHTPDSVTGSSSFSFLFLMVGHKEGKLAISIQVTSWGAVSV